MVFDGQVVGGGGGGGGGGILKALYLNVEWLIFCLILSDISIIVFFSLRLLLPRATRTRRMLGYYCPMLQIWNHRSQCYRMKWRVSY